MCERNHAKTNNANDDDDDVNDENIESKSFSFEIIILQHTK